MNFYKLLHKPKEIDWIGCWSKHTGEFNEIIGYTVLGGIILRSTSSQSYLLLYPLRASTNAKNYGVFDSLSEFENEILKEPTFPSIALAPLDEKDIESLEQNLGLLEKEEVYFPMPHPSIGGSWELETFEKGNVWVFADIAGQCQQSVR